MPPYWSLGFQLCRYGYKNLNEIKDVVAEMKKYGIPQVSLTSIVPVYRGLFLLLPSFLSILCSVL